MVLMRAWLVLLLLAPLAAAEEPEDAQSVWSELGQDGTVRIDVEPRNPVQGDQFVATLHLPADLAVDNITYQMCDVGSTCFAIGYPVEPRGDGSWELRTADEWRHSAFLSDGELRTFREGERIGWQYFIGLDDGTVITFPEGDECDVHSSEEDWVACQETHYFAVDIGATQATPGFPVALLMIALGFWVARRA